MTQPVPIYFSFYLLSSGEKRTLKFFWVLMTNRKLAFFPVVKPPKLQYQPFGIKVLEEQAFSAAIDRIVRQRLVFRIKIKGKCVR